MTDLIIPGLLLFIGSYGAVRGVDVFSALIDGAKKGLKTVLSIAPALVGLMCAIYMLRSSGALEALAGMLAPVLRAFGIPAETAPIMFLRPFSGSGALAIGSELMESFGPDSYIGRCAAIMLGSTETTFYVIATYFGACGIKKTRHAIPSALAADLTGFITAALMARLLF